MVSRLAIIYVVSWILLALAAKPMARRLGNPGSWPVVPLLGLLGALILAAASWPWPPPQGRAGRS